MSAIRKGLLVVALVAAPAIAIAQQPPTNVEKGRDVYRSWCASCHGRGNRFPGTTALQAKYGGKVPGRARRSNGPHASRGSSLRSAWDVDHAVLP